MTAIIAGMWVVGGTGEGVQVEGGAGVRGAAALGSRGEAPAGPGPPDCRETNLKYFMKKLCYGMGHDL